MDMTLSDYAAVQELQCERTKGWSSATALWVIVAVLIILAVVFNWTRNCNEKVEFATSLARLNGRIDCMEPDVRWAGQQLYAANGSVSRLAQGATDMYNNFGNQLFQLNDRVFYENNNRSGCGCGSCGNNGNREFAQTQTYNLASQAVTVTEKCRN